MSGFVFFIFSTFLFSFVCGFLISSYLKVTEKLDYIVLKGPWDVTVGVLVVFGFIIYFILDRIYDGRRESLLRIIYECLSMSVMTLIFCFVTDFTFSCEVVLTVFISNFILFPLLKLYKRWCDDFFVNKKYKNEQSLFYIVLFLFLIIVFGDIFLYFFLKFYS